MGGIGFSSSSRTRSIADIFRDPICTLIYDVKMTLFADSKELQLPEARFCQRKRGWGALSEFLRVGEVARWYKAAGKQTGALKTASNQTRLAILMTLYASEKCKEPLYFTALCKLHQIDEGLMTYHLRRLAQAGFVTKRNSDTLGDFYRVYSIEDSGKRLIEVLGLDRVIFDGRTHESESESVGSAAQSQS
jgi:DNA-binding MarR family transcriptional regulator